MQTQLAAVGLKINLWKCAVWGPGTSALSRLPVDHPLAVVPQRPFVPDSGLQVLGLPVDLPGTYGCTVGVLEDARSRLRKGLNALSEVQDAQVQHALL